MSDDPIPIRLQQFISERIRTYEQLEALFWLFSHRSETISKRSLGQTLHMHEARLEEAIESLVAARLVAAVPNSPSLVRYEPADSELHGSVSMLAALYETNRIQLVRVMAENSLQRVRQSALQTFADCLFVEKPRKRD